MYEKYTNHVSMQISKEIKQFVKEEVFGNSEYLFVTKIDGTNYAHCSKCNHEYDIINAKHNESGFCPMCGANLQVKLSRYGRQNCRNEACFYYFEKSLIDSNVIICKGYYVSKDYAKDYKNPEMVYSLRAIYIFEDKKATMLKTSWYNDNWEMKSSVFDFNQGSLAPKMCYLSIESIEKAIKGTIYQYIPYKMFEGHYSMVKVFREYTKYPGLEQISKAGFVQIVEAKLKGWHIYSCLNYKGKDMFEILKLSRNDIKEIRKSEENATPLFLRLYQLQVKDKSRLSPAEVKNIENYYAYDYIKLKNILKYTTMKKSFKYMEKQYTKYKKELHVKSNVVITLSDYIDDCIKLEMDLKDDHVLFPKNIYTAHQNTIKQVKIKVDETLNLKMEARIKALEKYNFRYHGLVIRAARNTNELIEEGKALSHCVGTYADRHAKGETNILFIRKASKPDKSYYTIEIKKDIIIQIHGKNNRSPSDDVKEFIEVFTEEKLTKKKVTIKNRVSISV